MTAVNTEFLLIATAGWFLYGAWLFRDVLFRKVENTPHWLAFATWALAGVALDISPDAWILDNDE